MASSPLLRSAGRVLHRAIPQGSVPWRPRAFFSDVAGRIEPCKMCGNPRTPMDGMERYKTDVQLQEALEQSQILLLQKKKCYDRAERRHKKIKNVVCALVCATTAACIYAPDNKVKSVSEGQSSI